MSNYAEISASVAIGKGCRVFCKEEILVGIAVVFLLGFLITIFNLIAIDAMIRNNNTQLKETQDNNKKDNSTQTNDASEAQNPPSAENQPEPNPEVDEECSGGLENKSNERRSRPTSEWAKVMIGKELSSNPFFTTQKAIDINNEDMRRQIWEHKYKKNMESKYAKDDEERRNRRMDMPTEDAQGM